MVGRWNSLPAASTRWAEPSPCSSKNQDPRRGCGISAGTLWWWTHEWASWDLQRHSLDGRPAGGHGVGGSLPCEARPCQGAGVGGRSLALPLGRCRAPLTTLIPKLKTHGQAVQEAGRPGHSPGARGPRWGWGWVAGTLVPSSPSSRQEGQVHSLGTPLSP